MTSQLAAFIRINTMINTLTTFGYNNGKVSNCDVVVDVRVLKGPEKTLRDKYTGKYTN